MAAGEALHRLVDVLHDGLLIPVGRALLHGPQEPLLAEEGEVVVLGFRDAVCIM